MQELLKIAEQAYNNVPFYYKLGNKNNIFSSKCDLKSMDDFERLPLVEKEDVIDNLESMIFPEYQVGDNMKDVSMLQTSGTTGECLNIIWSVSSYNNSMFGLWMARKKRYNISTNDRCCSFYYETNKYEYLMSGVKFTRDNNILAFDRKGLDECKIFTVYKMIAKFKPKWIMMWPTIANMLMECISKYNLPIFEELQYIELTGEFISIDSENAIKEFFKCEVANQYGTNETNSIAYECQNGHLHCMSSNVYVEIMSDGKKIPYGEYGDVYITTLKKNAMQFVRYGIGDKARLVDGKSCTCGNCNPIIELLNTRKSDWIYHESGKKISAYEVINAVEFLNDGILIMKKFQIIQKDFKHIEIKIVTSELFDLQKTITYETILAIFNSRICNPLLKDFEYNFIFCEDIKMGKFGKYRNFLEMNNK